MTRHSVRVPLIRGFKNCQGNFDSKTRCVLESPHTTIYMQGLTVDI